MSILWSTIFFSSTASGVKLCIQDYLDLVYVFYRWFVVIYNNYQDSLLKL